MRASTISTSIVLLAVSVTGHTVIQYPFPRYGGSDQLKQYPCGSNGQYNEFTSAVPLTTLSPGPQFIRFQETVSHNGAPFRLALTMNGDDSYDSYVLADHIPHAIGGQFGDYYVAYVIIPDVACTVAARCALQTIQIMTDKFGTGTCNNPVTSTMCGFVGGAYFSCGNVVINGTGSLANLAPFYSYANGTRATSIPSTLPVYMPGELAQYNKSSGGDWVVSVPPPDSYYTMLAALAAQPSSSASPGNGNPTSNPNAGDIPTTSGNGGLFPVIGASTTDYTPVLIAIGAFIAVVTVFSAIGAAFKRTLARRQMELAQRNGGTRGRDPNYV